MYAQTVTLDCLGVLYGKLPLAFLRRCGYDGRRWEDGSMGYSAVPDGAVRCYSIRAHKIICLKDLIFW